MAVAAVSFGAYIHGTTVVYPAVAIPSLKKSNLSVGLNDTDDDDGYNDAVLPFHITDDDISLIGMTAIRESLVLGQLLLGLKLSWVCAKLRNGSATKKSPTQKMGSKQPAAGASRFSSGPPARYYIGCFFTPVFNCSIGNRNAQCVTGFSI